ncbi:hypothetical protein COO91_02365 [Nostoc flagelliforme CCNUN1]|uniref:Uncharacterized protein n=1 Tax=Nostoc flagelliforme CCNUN1 TaxID=2038116 RepID=A0A2K8SMC3_9NOSO|nr:hypothetical protein COO91_02365 [Nostoc flagelliforme CCNUN1]
MPHIISSRVTQYQAQSITCVTICFTICLKFINSLIILSSSLSFQESKVMEHWALVISPSAPSSPLPYPFHQSFNSELVN